MRKAKAFFFVCAGLFLLALAYHLGARSAGAQAPGNPVVGVAGIPSWGWMAMTANGDVYFANQSTDTWSCRTNVFSSATSASSMSIGQLKAKYATPAPATSGR